MVIRQRAISSQQKERRRQAILDVASHMVEEIGYAAITMADVAQQAGLAKGTLYLYFKTKEALFLALQEQQLKTWFNEVDRRLQTLQRPASITTVAGLLTGSLAERPLLIRLLAVLHSALEQNIDDATARRFKQMLLRRLLRTGELLQVALPFLAPGEGARLLLLAHALVIGLQQLADPAPAVRRILQEPELALFRVDFTHELAHALRALLYGLEAEQGDRHHDGNFEG
jgi:AcrR family transcriptional regulator